MSPRANVDGPGSVLGKDLEAENVFLCNLKRHVLQGEGSSTTTSSSDNDLHV